REKATRWLLNAGPEARPALRQALKSDDPEVARRARDILRKLKKRRLAKAPREFAELLKGYDSADAGHKEEALDKLFSQGGSGQALALELLADEEDVPFREQFLERERDLPNLVALLLADGNFAEAEALLETHVRAARKLDPKEGSDIEAVLKNYAIF